MPPLLKFSSLVNITAHCRSEEELAIALRNRAELETTTKGLFGKLVEVREHDVVLALPFPGRAYIRKTDIATPPPTRFAPGTRVKTPYGKGVVRQLRVRPETPAGFDYVVDLIECKMAGHKLAAPAVSTGYLAPSQLSFRSDDERTAAERLADAEVLRSQGNDAFKASEHTDAAASRTAALRRRCRVGERRLTHGSSSSHRPLWQQVQPAGCASNIGCRPVAARSSCSRACACTATTLPAASLRWHAGRCGDSPTLTSS